MTLVEDSGGAFERALEKFKAGLTYDQIQYFQCSRRSDLSTAIEVIQQRHESEKRLCDMQKLRGFLEAMTEYGKIADVFANTSPFVAFIWGPMKFLLQSACAFTDSFTALLDAYQQIGDNLPLLEQYESLLKSNPQVTRVLEWIYEDILAFHQQALKRFTRKNWRKFFDATWKTFNTDFTSILGNIQRHKTLLESQTSLAQLEECQKMRTTAESALKIAKEAELARRRNVVQDWLQPADIEDDQECKRCARFPGTGCWLLRHDRFKQWFDLSNRFNPLLWLNGRPGAGKTILANMIITECQRPPSSTAIYFYCRHDDPYRNTFLALARSLLYQILKDNPDILDHLYEASTKSVKTLRSTETSKRLLKDALMGIDNTFVVVDGLDECKRDEQRTMINFFEDFFSSQPFSGQTNLRCLLVSQDDAVPHRLLSSFPTIKIKPDDNKSDIEIYVNHRSKDIQSKFELGGEMTRDISTKVQRNAGGVFLLVKLVLSHLECQTSRANLDEELSRDMPTGLEQIYARIVDTIFTDAPATELKETSRLLTWIVCAKRPLKWREMQGAIAIDMDGQTVDFESRQLRNGAKDFCGSLIDKRPNGGIELVHTTAKRFLINTKRVRPIKGDLELANLCISYLKLPGLQPSFGDNARSGLVRKGYFVFLDYAASCWSAHLASACEEACDYEELKTLVEELSEDIEIFLDIHWRKDQPVASNISKKSLKQLRSFQDYDFLESLARALEATQSQLQSYTHEAATNEVLDIPEIVQSVRQVLEDLSGQADEQFQRMYGSDLFKCPRMNCDAFFDGFTSHEKRKRHVAKHERLFRCSFPSCPRAEIGFETSRDREEHIAESHIDSQYQGTVFPSKKEIDESRKEANQTNELSSTGRYQCHLCSGTFTRRFNLTAHLNSHADLKSFICSRCNRAFSREQDMKRHEVTQHGVRKHVCSGTFQKALDGAEVNWGCNKAFKRADSLRSHHKTDSGRLCIKPLLDNEAEEQQREQEALQGPQGQEMLARQIFQCGRTVDWAERLSSMESCSSSRIAKTQPLEPWRCGQSFLSLAHLREHYEQDSEQVSHHPTFEPSPDPLTLYSQKMTTPQGHLLPGVGSSDFLDAVDAVSSSEERHSQRSHTSVDFPSSNLASDDNPPSDITIEEGSLLPPGTIAGVRSSTCNSAMNSLQQTDTRPLKKPRLSE